MTAYLKLVLAHQSIMWGKICHTLAQLELIIFTLILLDVLATLPQKLVELRLGVCNLIFRLALREILVPRVLETLGRRRIATFGTNVSTRAAIGALPGLLELSIPNLIEGSIVLFLCLRRLKSAALEVWGNRATLLASIEGLEHFSHIDSCAAFCWKSTTVGSYSHVRGRQRIVRLLTLPHNEGLAIQI